MTDLVRLGEGGHDGDADFSKLLLSRKDYLRIVMQVIACGGRLNKVERKKLLATELMYGIGDPGVYGTCLYGKWVRDGIHDVIQVSAFCGHSPTEMWDTVAHELVHVLAGPDVGHGPEWKSAARKLGMLNPKAAGVASAEDLNPGLVTVLMAIPLPTDGQPNCDEGGGTPSKVRQGCKLSVGTREGKTHEAGTRRLRLWLCECKRPVRARVASDDFRARCLTCGALFRRAGAAAETTALVKNGETGGGGVPPGVGTRHREVVGQNCARS